MIIIYINIKRSSSCWNVRKYIIYIIHIKRVHVANWQCDISSISQYPHDIFDVDDVQHESEHGKYVIYLSYIRSRPHYAPKIKLNQVHNAPCLPVTLDGLLGYHPQSSNESSRKPQNTTEDQYEGAGYSPDAPETIDLCIRPVLEAHNLQNIFSEFGLNEDELRMASITLRPIRGKKTWFVLK